MGFSRQKYWSGLPFPTQGGLPNPGIEPMSLVSSALAGGFFTTAQLGSPLTSYKREKLSLLWKDQAVMTLSNNQT